MLAQPALLIAVHDPQRHASGGRHELRCWRERQHVWRPIGRFMRNLAVQKGLKLRHRAYGSSAGLTAADLQVSNGLSASALEPESMSLIVQPMLLAQSLS